MRNAENVVAVHLPKDLVERIDQAAADDDRSRVGMVRRLVAEGLQRRAETVDDGSRVRNIHYQRGELTR
jgi:metal-responsive CopG/Arc/MetJ family transcriptional regulator